MTALTCHEAELSLGALAVGALDVDDQRDVRAHLAGCARCRRTMADLKDATDLMGRVSLESAERAAVGDLPPRPVTDLRPSPRRRVLLVAAAATAVAVALGVGVLARGGTGTTDTTDTTGTAAVRLQATDPRTQVHADVTLRPTEVGTEVALQIRGVPSRETCRLVVVSADGRRTVAASWLATYAGTATVTGTTDLSRTEIAQLLVTALDGRLLVSVPVRT